MKIENIINLCKKKMLDAPKKDGHWVYEIEADTTIPSEGDCTSRPIRLGSVQDQIRKLILKLKTLRYLIINLTC